MPSSKSKSPSDYHTPLQPRSNDSANSDDYHSPPLYKTPSELKEEENLQRDYRHAMELRFHPSGTTLEDYRDYRRLVKESKKKRDIKRRHRARHKKPRFDDVYNPPFTHTTNTTRRTQRENPLLVKYRNEIHNWRTIIIQYKNQPKRLKKEFYRLARKFHSDKWRERNQKGEKNIASTIEESDELFKLLSKLFAVETATHQIKKKKNPSKKKNTTRKKKNKKSGKKNTKRRKKGKKSGKNTNK
jgi:hypothetical protein